MREHTSAVIAADSWVVDGNKHAVRDLVWPRADTLVWLDCPLIISLWGLGKRALWRASVIRMRAAEQPGEGTGLSKQFALAAKGVLTALRSHMGQCREYPKLLAKPENQYLAVVFLRSPHATRRW